MQVNVRLFAVYREKVGQPAFCLEVKPGAKVIEVWNILREQYPRLPPVPPATAVNMEYTGLETELQADDEVAFLPPVSGG